MKNRKKYPKSCDKCDIYEIAKNLITNNCCGNCPNRESVKLSDNGSDEVEKKRE